MNPAHRTALWPRLAASWLELVAPRARDAAEALHEQTTKTVLLSLCLIVAACAPLFGVGWSLRLIPGDMFAVACGLAALCGGGWLFVHRTGRWRGARALPPAVLLATALVDTWRYGPTAITAAEYCLVVVMAGVLLSARGQWLALAGSLAGLSAGILLARQDAGGVAADALLDVVSFGLLLIVIAVLLRLLNGQFDAALRRSRDTAAALADELAERRRAQEALRGSERRYRTLSETISDFAYAGHFDERGSWVQEWSAGSLLQATGRRPEELEEPDGLLTLVHPDDRLRVRERNERVRAGEAVVCDYRLQARDGRELWVTDFMRPERDPTGAVRGACGAAQDVSERKRAEAALKAIVASAIAGEGRIFDGITASVCEWLDVEGACVVECVSSGLQYASLRLDGRASPVRALTTELSACGEVVRSGPLMLTSGAARAFPGDPELAALGAEGFGGLPLPDVAGHTIGVLAVFGRRPLVLPAQAAEALATIATLAAAELARRRADRERVAIEARLRQSEKMEAIGQLAGGVAHDFNNQLVGIMGYADLLRVRLGDEPQRRYVEAILTASRRAADLTRQLLAFARRGQYISVAVDLHAVIGEVVGLLERSIDKQINIRCGLAADPAFTLGDPSQLQGALLNIALNARDAMPTGGELTFATETVTLDGAACPEPEGIRPGRFVRIRVTDTGVGMDDEIRRRLFEPFFTTKPPGKGTGMGLAAVYGTVRAHGGCVEVASQVARGTTVTVDLPAVDVVAERPVVEPTPEAVTGAHVMVVDDEEVVRSVVVEGLAELGYRVTACADGEEAVAYYRGAWSGVGLVLLDMVMPRMGGHETYLAMRRIHPDVRVLLCSGYSLSAEARALLAQEGVVGFVQKPFQIADLARIVAEALTRR